METSPVAPSLKAPGLRIDTVKVVWRDDPAMVREHGRCGPCEGCYAVAEVSYPVDGGSGDRRLEKFQSSGLSGIDASSTADYRAQVERGQLDDLAEHLKVFGVPVPEPLVATS